MGKRYSEGEFLRKIRRALMVDGLERDVRLVPRPPYRASVSQTLVEMRTTTSDGTVLIHHHNTGSPGSPADIERICAEHRARPGIAQARVAEILACAGPSVRTEDGHGPLVVRTSSDMPLMVLASATLHDIAGRTHDRTLSLPDGPVAHWWSKHDDVQTLELGMDRARRGPTGQPRPLRIDGGLAETLRRLPDGATRLDAMVGALAEAIDQGGRSDDHTPITIDGVNMVVDGIPLSAGPRGLRIKDMWIGGATLTGTTLIVPRRLPETLTMAIAGRRLDEVVSPPPLDGAIRIVRAQARKSATALTLALPPTTLDALRTELAGETAP